MKKHSYICPTCRHTRFKTIQKNSSYRCRKCMQVVVKDLGKFKKTKSW